jgi:branched-subunit amino acid transport protein
VDAPNLNLWLLLGLCVASTYVWRFAGTAIARHIDPDSAVFRWIACVAYGMLAALISRMVFIPAGTMAETVMADRLIALAAGFVVFFIFRCNFFAGTIGAFTIFLLLSGLRDSGIL